MAKISCFQGLDIKDPLKACIINKDDDEVKRKKRRRFTAVYAFLGFVPSSSTSFCFHVAGTQRVGCKDKGRHFLEKGLF